MKKTLKIIANIFALLAVSTAVAWGLRELGMIPLDRSIDFITPALAFALISLILSGISRKK